MSAPHLLLANVFFAPFSYGGATVVAEQVARALQARHGWRVTALSAVSRRDLPDYALRRTLGGTVDSYLVNLPSGRSPVQMYDNPQVTEVMARLIRRLAPDMVQLHCLQELGIGLVAATRQADLPLVISTHDYWWICARQFMMRPDGLHCGQDQVRLEDCRACSPDMQQMRHRRTRLQAAAMAAGLMTFPSSFARDLCLRSGLAPERAAVWENGVQLPDPGFFAAQARRRAADPRLVFGYCGGPSEMKGWPLIHRAFAGLQRRDFRVILADGGLHAPWWRPSATAGLPGDWRIHPRYEQARMDDFWAEIDVLLFPSQWPETFGLTLREALARGIRVIQTDMGGTLEHDGPDRSRALPAGSSATDLRDALRFALDRPDPHPRPVPTHSFDDQADAFVALTAPLLAGRGATVIPDRGTIRAAGSGPGHAALW